MPEIPQFRLQWVSFFALGGMLLACAVVCAMAANAPPDTQPAVATTNPTTDPTKDPTMDWLLGSATTLPVTEPATNPTESPQTQPAVLESTNTVTAPTRGGVVTLSDGSVFRGRLSTTLRQPIRVWDAKAERYQDVPFSLIQAIQVHVVWQTQEKEWRFAASGSDIKEYSGRTYPARQTDYTLTLKDGSTVTGGVAAPIYMESEGGQRTFVLHKRDKGEAGQSLADLVYVKTVEFRE